MKYIDLRSDTVTHPTEEMRQAMMNASVGDDVYGDDQTTTELEALAAEAVGKEAALFVPSGTFGNQLALFTHCERGNEVILGDDCHIVAHEVGAASVIAGVQLRTLASRNGMLDPLEIEAKIRGTDIHYPKTGLICLENAHSNGRVIPLENMEQIYSLAKKNSIPVHLDGARIFNAAVRLKVSAAEVAKYADSVMFCLSKGLCAPVGSILAGSKSFIRRARKGRKLLGGGMRQTGILAAAGKIALEKMAGRVAKDHDNALLLGQGLAKIPGIEVMQEAIQINMVFFDMSKTGVHPDKLVKQLDARGIKINGAENGIMRFVTHYWIGPEEVQTAVAAVKEILELEIGR